MKTLKMVAALLALVSQIVACSSNDGESAGTGGMGGAASGSGGATSGSGGTAPQTDPNSLRLGTFNTALVSVVKGATERKPLIIDAIKSSSQDILCLQELFSPIDIGQFAQELSAEYPYNHYSESGESAFGNGLLILSRFPLQEKKELAFQAKDPASFTDRMLISADAKVGDTEVHLLCSHLLAGLDEDSTRLRAAQMTELRVFAEQQGYLDEPTVVLGDFNFGPDPVMDCTQASDPACLAPDMTTYAQALQTFDDPNEDWEQCTQCRELFLPMQVLELYGDEPDQRIDHCFTASMGQWSFEGRQTIFSDGIELELEGETIGTLSDHLGVACDFKR